MKLLSMLKAALRRVFGLTSTPKENGFVRVLEKRCAEKDQKVLQPKKPSVVAKTARRKKDDAASEVPGVQPGKRRKRVRLGNKSGTGFSGNTAKRKTSGTGKGSK